MFRWLIGSAVSRAGEARLPTWDEFDLDAALSTVPAERMKGRVEHSVRLAPRALGISCEARATYPESALVSPAQSSGCQSLI